MKITLIVLVLAMFLVSGCAIKDCQTDLNCFKELVKDCSKAKVNIIYHDNNLRLTSRGIWLEDCRLSFKIEQISEKLRQEDPNLAMLAEGKTLNCAIPLQVVEQNQDEIIDNILNLEEQFNEYCSGPIKDALQGPLKNAVKEKMGMNIPLN